jgi:hypothetical protein
MTLPFLLCASVTAISAAVSLGFSVAAARSRSGDGRIMALYATARSLALMIASAASFLVTSVVWLEAVAGCMIMVQLGDAAIGVIIKDGVKTLGPGATAILNLAALWWLLA